MLFQTKKPHYEHLRKKWTGTHKALQENLFTKHAKYINQLAVGGLGGIMLLSGGGNILPNQHFLTSGGQILSDTEKNSQLATKLSDKLPDEMRSLNVAEEDNICQILSDSFGFAVVPELEGVRLNRSYGLIGGEQHLYRFPGDSLEKHAENSADWAMFGNSGIAPGLGAWGYFAPSQSQFSEQDKQKERYYIAVQTFLAPGFAENVVKYRDFFKYKKMLLVNPKTGQAVVAVIGDAGPAEWTGKHLGGSPEVMHYLGLATGPRKGAVLYFFLDDPKNQTPLGPISVKNQKALADYQLRVKA